MPGQGWDIFANLLDLTIDSTVALDGAAALPEAFALHANFPNPFNPITTIRFDLPASVELSVAVYDILGREVARLAAGKIEAGYRQVIWNGRDEAGRPAPSGVYITRLVTPQFSKSIKMVLLR